MLLYGIYRNAKPIEVVNDEEKKMPAEQVINIVVIGNSEVHPIDSFRSSCDKSHQSDDAVTVADVENQTDHNDNEEEERAVARAPEEPCGKPNLQVDSPVPVLVLCAA